MATIQSPGIGSGLDINSLVEKLVAAERAPGDAQLTRRESKATLQISALATLKGTLASFQAALAPLKSTDGLNPHAATSSDEDIATVIASETAATGTYDIDVVDLAKAHQLASKAFTGGTTSVVGTGTLTITQDGKSFDVEIDSSNDTLAGIRNAINSAAGNTSVQATIINEVNGSRLVLTSSSTGATKSIEVTRSGGDGGLDQLVYDPGTLTNLTELQPAQDAHIKIAGRYDFYSPSNAVTGAIDGLKIELHGKTEAGRPLTVSVSDDNDALIGRVKAFVAGYNTLNTTLAGLRSYDATTKTAGPLLGDSLLLGTESDLRSNLINPVQGLSLGSNTLAAIGISRQLDGSLELDETQLQKALQADSGSVSAVFGAQDGIATRLFNTIETRLSSTAGLETRNKSLQQEITDVQDDRDALDARMLVIEDRYRKQFTAMDTLLASLTTTSNYLAQQLENLPTPRKD
jgi:flagellar hook-associated protein 2